MEPKTTPRPGTDATQTPLPVERAFVVQLRAQVDPGAELIVGRAEHMASGVSARFGSPEELIGFITHVLAMRDPSPLEPLPSKPGGGRTT